MLFEMLSSVCLTGSFHRCWILRCRPIRYRYTQRRSLCIVNLSCSAASLIVFGTFYLVPFEKRHIVTPMCGEVMFALHNVPRNHKLCNMSSMTTSDSPFSSIVKSHFTYSRFAPLRRCVSFPEDRPSPVPSLHS